MKVKKIVAPSMPEAMNQIRKELGPDAVILNSKEIQTGGFMGLFRKKQIEVVAALDPQPIRKNTKYSSDPPLLKNMPKQRKQESNENNNVLAEIKHLKKIVEQQVARTESRFPADYEVMYQYLLNQEVVSEIAESIVHHVQALHDEQHMDCSPTVILEGTKKEIIQRLQKYPMEGIDYTKKIVQFVGPTGVGKTTTLAKIAAKSVLKDGKKVAFITADTYRIAAIEQLKTYANILEVPVEVVYNANDYKKAIAGFSDYDLIMVDTAGRNFLDDTYIHELKDIVNLNEQVETYLVLSLTAKQNDLLKIQKQFQQVAIKSIIFTKLDETKQYGSMITVPSLMGKGIAYITNGQDVPDDLLEPTPQKICDLIVGAFFND